MPYTVEDYLQSRLNEFFSPFSDDFTLTVVPHASLSASSYPSRALRPYSQERGTILSAKMDLLEKPDGYTVRVELPGINKEDIEVDVNKNVLSIKAERKTEKTTEHEKYHYCERSYGKVERQVALPQNCDGENVAASFENGVLAMDFAKKKEDESRRKITIA